MSEIVFILGAGASRSAGAPLMQEFLDTARALWSASPNSAFEQDLRAVFGTISKLQAVHSKSELDLINLEAVFGAFEMAALLQLKQADPGLVTSMKRVIAWTLDNSVKFAVRENKVNAPQDYAEFVDMVINLKRSCSVITFNYDAALDVSLEIRDASYSYCFTESETPQIPLLKLHGSVNWGLCGKCGEIVAVKLKGRARPGLDSARLGMLHEAKEPHCGVPMNECFIVPPTWDKSSYRPSIEGVWRRAAKELCEATDIIVCGYSLPETDHFFRYLYALGTVGDAMLRRFWVFDPAPDVHERFRMLLGPGARARFNRYPYTFAQALPHLRGYL